MDQSVNCFETAGRKFRHQIKTHSRILQLHKQRLPEKVYKYACFCVAVGACKMLLRVDRLH